VLGCRPGSPAARAGIQYGDVLLSVNNVATPDWAAYIEARKLSRERMHVELFRAGEHLIFELELPTSTAPIDAAGLLEDLVDSGVAAMISRGSRPDPEPS
jgi:S1-C subfamily serine protease